MCSLLQHSSSQQSDAQQVFVTISRRLFKEANGQARSPQLAVGSQIQQTPVIQQLDLLHSNLV